MKKLMSAVLAAALVFSASACAPEAKEKGNDAGAKEQQKKMVIHLNGIDEDIKMQKAMKEIQTLEKYKNVKFDFHGREADFMTAVPIAIAGGNQVDIIVVANPMIQQQWADAGTIVPLDDIAKSIGVDFNKEYGPYVANASNNGKLYTVPHNITRWALYYNKAIFDKAGVAYPDPKVPMTWDQYRETAKKLTSGSGASKVYGAFYLPWGTFWYGDAIMELGGGEHFYNDKKLSNIEHPAFARSMERVFHMMHTDGSMPSHANTVTAKTDPPAFMNGKYGMDIQGGWVLPWAADKTKFPRDWKIGVAPLPVDSGSKMKTWGIVNGFGISPTSADPKLALDIAVELSRLSAKYADSSESANRTVEQKELFDVYNKALAEDGITSEQLKHIFASPDTIFVGEKIMGPNNVKYEKVVTEEVEKYLVKEQDLAKTIANIKERGDKTIQSK
ncbi:extracellular solute-binding protein [Paenibacillus sp. YYML68]|uniref:extracellular solute-binding protein n=1 Tax=Paenibacillus sp. YYML68 TaxID=2909250 RepID=UPI0024905DB9|nr:extracellular solute-binding protein [Paenibacillus sp. YYML68]